MIQMPTWARALLGLLATLACLPAAATLVGRDLDSSRAGFEAYYDTEQNLSWLADGSAARSSGRSADGTLRFDEAVAWAAHVDIHGISGWRLPTFRVPVQDNCPRTASHDSCDVPSAQSELMHLLRVGLGLRSPYEPGVGPTLISFAVGLSAPLVPGVDPDVVLRDVGSLYWIAGLSLQEVACPTGADCSTPADGFSSAPRANGYWSADGQHFIRCLIPAHCAPGQDTGPLPPDPVTGRPSGGRYLLSNVVSPWTFDMLTADHLADTNPDLRRQVWLVRDGDVGDVAAVPEPSTIGLSCAGLALALRATRRGTR